MKPGSALARTLLVLSAVAAGHCARRSPAQADAAEFAPVLSVKELMEQIVDPVADWVFDAAVIDVTEKGIVETVPLTDDDWQKVERGAMILAESANLLKMPRAMVAPTPVSSYLHSAAMVAAGVFLLERLFPLVHRARWLPEALFIVGLSSIALGGFLALSRDDMKRVLAYSTIGQYGYVVVLIALGGRYGAVGAAMREGENVAR